MERKLKIKDEYLKLIIDLGYDYDGMETQSGLKELIDGIVDLARKALVADDKASIYENFGENKKYYNILREEIKDVK